MRGKTTENVTTLILQPSDSGNHTCTATDFVGADCIRNASASIVMDIVGKCINYSECMIESIYMHCPCFNLLACIVQVLITWTYYITLKFSLTDESAIICISSLPIA